MGDATGKIAVTTQDKAPSRERALQSWRPFEGLRREVDRLFDDFDRGAWPAAFRRSIFDVEPFWSRAASWATEPAVDIVEKEKTYEISAELPGMDEKNIEVKLVNGSIMIKGEKAEERESKKKDYYLHERSFGTFERCFAVPEGVDADKVEAQFKKGVLTVTLPKKPEMIKPEKKIEVKAAA
ncbi:MAG: Hsp20/alpha crystallin family protein [Alphaproteobacteria bacterium]|nr:Hsp20/alpha crystallin family protein [Alphaproteobacteria bacterium]